MGRLTLNILLSFAQFERELIGERIRDKFAASRARGIWMGGKVPLGYDVKDRKLVVNPAGAATVRMIFEQFIEFGSCTELAKMLQQRGVTTKTGRPIDKGYLYKLLANRTYIGDAPHKGMIHKGEHEAVVPLDLWNRVHDMLQVSPRTKANQNRSQTPALLRGLIFGIDGRALSPVHTLRRGRQYRYYVSQSVLKGDAIDDPSLVRRIAAAEIEDAVMAQVRALLRQPEIIVGTWRAAQADVPEITEAETREALESLDPMWEELFPSEQARIVQALVDRVTVGPTGVDIRLKVEGLTGLVQELAPRHRVREAA